MSKARSIVPVVAVLAVAAVSLTLFQRYSETHRQPRSNRVFLRRLTADEVERRDIASAEMRLKARFVKFLVEQRDRERAERMMDEVRAHGTAYPWFPWMLGVPAKYSDFMNGKAER